MRRKDGEMQERWDLPVGGEKKALLELTKESKRGWRWLKNRMLAEFSGYENGKLYN